MRVLLSWVSATDKTQEVMEVEKRVEALVQAQVEVRGCVPRSVSSPFGGEGPGGCSCQLEMQVLS